MNADLQFLSGNDTIIKNSYRYSVRIKHIRRRTAVEGEAPNLDNYTAVVVLSCLTVFVLGILVFENARLDKTTKRLFYLTYASIILATVAEWLGIALNGAPEWTIGIHRAVKCADYIVTPVAGVCFALQISDKKERRNHIWVMAILAANAVFELASVFTEWTFYIDSENYYCHGPLYFIYVIIYCIAIADVLFSFLKYSKNFRKKNKASLYAIIILVCMGIGFQEFGDSSIRTSCLSLAFGSVLLFIHYNEFLQQRKDDDLYHQKLLIETDALTGALSRYAYIETLREYHRKGALPEDLVVFSIDINGLKAVNDNLGHISGDRLIKGAAECISEVLGRYGKCFRIGGDEFVAITSIDRDKIPQVIGSFDTVCERINEASGIGLSLALGYAAAKDRPDETVDSLINTADKMMYMNKEEHYRNAGLPYHGSAGSEDAEPVR